MVVGGWPKSPSSCFCSSSLRKKAVLGVCVVGNTICHNFSRRPMRDIDIANINMTAVNSAVIGDLVLIQLSHILIFCLHNARWVIVHLGVVCLDSFIDCVFDRRLMNDWAGRVTDFVVRASYQVSTGIGTEPEAMDCRGSFLSSGERRSKNE
jgi:hypothetical protein